MKRMETCDCIVTIPLPLSQMNHINTKLLVIINTIISELESFASFEESSSPQLNKLEKLIIDKIVFF